jgi:hypothetical protein
MARKRTKRKDASLEKIIRTSLPENLGKAYIKRIRHWRKYKGVEWTANRLKTVWNVALLFRSGENDQIQEVCRSARMRVRDGLPAGIEGVLVKTWAQIQQPAKLRRVASALRAYTALYLKKLSKAQLAKSRRSINEQGSHPSIEPLTEKLQKELLKGKTLREISKGEKVLRTLYPFPLVNGSAKVLRDLELPELGNLSGVSAYPHKLKLNNRDFKYDGGQLPFVQMSASLLTHGFVPQCLIDKLGDFELRKLAASFESDHHVAIRGKISAIQEGGAKGRIVATPTAWIQFYCYPYHKYLMKNIKRLESNYGIAGLQYGRSCCLDQVSGIHQALQILNDGHQFCQAVDLSSATDRFPLEVQQALCYELGIPEFAEALNELKGPWLSPDGQSYWTYNSGQPMGLYGSFALFHLTHYCVLNALSHELQLNAAECNFCVLGDDVLIFSEPLRDAYLKVLEEWQVPISWHKSYSGNVVEFAGFILTKTNKGWTAFRPYKHGKDGRFTSPISVLHALGIKTTQWSERWKQSFESYSRNRALRDLDLQPIFLQDNLPHHEEGSLPGVAYFGTLINKLSYYTTKSGTELPLEIADAWFQDRYHLCKTKMPENDPYYYGEVVPTDKIFEDRKFEPRIYSQVENYLKRAFWRTFTIQEDYLTTTRGLISNLEISI